MKISGLLLKPATVISKKRGDAPEVHYLIGPQRESREEAETDLARWEKSIPIEGLGKSETSFERWWDSLPVHEKVVPLHGNSGDIAERVWNAARESAATTVKAAGCICHELVRGGQARFRSSGHYQSVVAEHDPRCPITLTRQIREAK